MDRGLPDDFTVTTAVALAARAPSVHNTQPWRWGLGDESLHLYADQGRHLSETDPDGRDLLLSCGAALHHARTGFAALGWQCEIHRLPNPAEPDHLASIELHRATPCDIELAAAIPRRRTDRRRFSSWPVPPGQIESLAALAADEGAVLRRAEGTDRYTLAEAIDTAYRRHQDDPAYRTELAAWSGRHSSPDGVPAKSATAPDPAEDALASRPFADPQLTQPASAEEDAAALLVLSTASDDRISLLRAGEATSAVLLAATAVGLASCPLTEPLEIADVRDLVRHRVTGDRYPQMVLRVGWAPINADPLPATPRRPLEEVLRPLRTIASSPQGKGDPR